MSRFKKFIENKYSLLIFSAFFLAIMLRVPALWQELPPYQFCDEGIYFSETLRLINDNAIVTNEFRAGGMNIYPVWLSAKFVGLFIPITDKSLLILGRVLYSVLLSSAAIFFISGAARQISQSKFVGFIAAILFLLSPSLLAFSRYWYPDHFLIFFVSGVLYFSVLLMARPKNLWVFSAIAVFFAGAISTKYTSVFLILPIMIFSCLSIFRSVSEKNITNLRLIYGLFVAFISFVFSLIIFNFSAFLRPALFIEGFRFNLNNYGGTGTLDGITFYLFCIFVLPLGLLGIFGLIIGTYKMWAISRMYLFGLLIVPVFISFYLGVQGLVINRNALIAIPFVFVICAVGVSEALSLFANSRRMRQMVLVILGCFALLQLAQIVNSVTNDFKPDARVTATKWLQESNMQRNLVGTNEFCSGDSPASQAGFETVLDPSMSHELELYVFNSYWPSEIQEEFLKSSAAHISLDQKYVHFYFINDRFLPTEFLDGLFRGKLPAVAPEGYSFLKTFEGNGPVIAILKKD